MEADAMFESRVRQIDERLASRPVDWSPEYGGYWTMSAYELVTKGLRDPSLFRSGRPFVSLPSQRNFIPLTYNGEAHALYRKVLTPLFRPSRIALLEPIVRETTRAYLESFIASGGGDFIESIGSPLPAHVLCIFLGLPTDQVPLLKSMSLNPRRPMTDEELADVDAKVTGHIEDVLAQRRTHPRDPDGDFFSAMLEMRIDDQPLSDRELVEIGKQMVAAGHGTTTAAMNSIMLTYATDPQLGAGLRAGDFAPDAAVEEVLRLAPPLGGLGREANVPDDEYGVHIARDDAVEMDVAAANRDAREFAEPARARYGRQPNRHLSFGSGVHGCLGAPLARLELRVLLEEILASGAHFVLDGEPTPSPLRHFRYLALPVRVEV